MEKLTEKLRTVARELRYLWRERGRGWNFWRVTIREWLLEDGARQGLGGPPNNWQGSATYRDGRHGAEWSARFLDDATDIGIAVKYPDDGESRWKVMIPPKVFRRLALWYLWRWAYGDWFGLRRLLYFRWLHRHVARMKAMRGW